MDHRAAELAALADAEGRIRARDASCGGERRRGRTFAVELAVEGSYPQTQLVVRARQADSGDTVYEEAYDLWVHNGCTWTIDGVVSAVFDVNLEEEVRTRCFFLWSRPSPDPASTSD